MYLTEAYFRREWPGLARHLPNVSVEARSFKSNANVKSSSDFEAYPLFRDIALAQEKEIAALKAEIAHLRSGIVPKDWWKRKAH